MQLIFSDSAIPQDFTKSLFLAGPSPRTLEIRDWRRDAVAYLEQIGYDGVVFIPAPKGVWDQKPEDKESFNYDGQVDWEQAARHRSDAIVFWVPRVVDRERADLGMPGFTTNFELGEDYKAGKVFYGRPASAEKCRYLDKCVTAVGITPFETLSELLDAVAENLGDGAPRAGAETQVPLFIWRTKQFQGWYRALRGAGNSLRHAELLHSVRARQKNVFCFTMAVHIWVEEEQRVKSNEVIVARPNVGSVVAYGTLRGERKVVLVKEFRSPVNNPQGFVYELPSGSSVDEGEKSLVVASHELEEEVGLKIEDVSRFSRVGSRQLVATFTTHRANVYKVELTEAELEQLEALEATNEPRGCLWDSEQTYVKVVSLNKLTTYPVDYATLGIIFEAIFATGEHPERNA